MAGLISLSTAFQKHFQCFYRVTLFENLYRNAVEHGGSEVTVTVGTLKDGFYIEDDGVGVPDGEQRST